MLARHRCRSHAQPTKLNARIQRTQLHSHEAMDFSPRNRARCGGETATTRRRSFQRRLGPGERRYWQVGREHLDRLHVDLPDHHPKVLLTIRRRARRTHHRRRFRSLDRHLPFAIGLELDLDHAAFTLHRDHPLVDLLFQLAGHFDPSARVLVEIIVIVRPVERPARHVRQDVPPSSFTTQFIRCIYSRL